MTGTLVSKVSIKILKSRTLAYKSLYPTTRKTRLHKRTAQLFLIKSDTPIINFVIHGNFSGSQNISTIPGITYKRITTTAPTAIQRTIVG